MANGNGTTATEAIEAIREAKGFVSTAAKRLGISRVQLYRIINNHPTVKEALTDTREEMKDFAEAVLFQNIRDGKETSLIFYLKTRAKDRGYIEKQELSILVEKELEKALNLLESKLDAGTYRAVLAALAE